MKTTWITPDLMADFEAENTNVYRFATAPDGAVERFGGDILVSFTNEAARERLAKEYFLWAQSVDFTLRRMFGRFLPKRNAERQAPRLLLGNPDDDLHTVVVERHLRYGLDFGGGYSVGLFPDQRENREYVRRVKPYKLLNCFAYTCSFSVAAASVGAETVSVDLSRKSLDRGRGNFSLNQIPLTGHRFIADDVLEMLPRLARKGEKFDLIILDPPTFSRSPRGKVFQVESDFEQLLLSTFDVAERDARILLSTNCTKLDSRALEVMARFCLKRARRAGNFHRQPLPPDFPPGSAASTIWLTLR